MVKIETAAVVVMSETGAVTWGHVRKAASVAVVLK